ncbi:hypothetical protein M3661_25110 [Paenibacillus sp. MER 180]|uniref:hypothetical protein n=1 Tax=unclassified Paenibacillus TaxID=185978 RepID=UPI0008066891|nr:MULTISPECIES: hypothetical protein [unclassified Paenibacillus]MCM3293388.1 hypothetical protein [Paenibacillus sp. MER 180]OBY80731.1 hypothetical protein BBG47_04545 [Paenibacillus sp. KS1]
MTHFFSIFAYRTDKTLLEGAEQSILISMWKDDFAAYVSLLERWKQEGVRVEAMGPTIMCRRPSCRSCILLQDEEMKALLMQLL